MYLNSFITFFVSWLINRTVLSSIAKFLLQLYLSKHALWLGEGNILFHEMVLFTSTHKLRVSAMFTRKFDNPLF
jgi:hypothetical protein